MRIFPGPLVVALIAFGVAGAAAAAPVEAAAPAGITITRIAIAGVSPEMEANVRRRLSLERQLDRTLGAQRFDYLLRQAERETREALEPYGYFSPKVTLTPPPTDRGELRIDVALDEPVRVRTASVAVAGPGADDPLLAAAIAGFAPAKGDVFDQVRYETSKARISRGLAEHGYFDAALGAHRVEVTRAERTADIALAWDSGERYKLGAVTYAQVPEEILDPDVLAKIITWTPGAPYDATRLDKLRASLLRLDYFSGIDIAPAPEQATDRVVPVHIALTPAPKHVYTAGVGYGSTNGLGVRAGIDWRWLNRRGHKALAEFDWAQRRKSIAAQYRVPGFAWVEGWYAGGFEFVDEQTDYIDNRKVDVGFSRSGEINDRWRVLASVHALRERWAYVAEDDGDPATPTEYRYATMLYPEASGEYLHVDQRLAPRRGFGGSALLRGGVEGVGSDASFVQVHAHLRWFHGLGDDSRLLARGEIGYTHTRADVAQLPPTLRFHAGGDRSIRGYGWREVGPRVGAVGDEFPVGASKVVTASLEYERYFGGPWGMAVFVDTGSAFDDSPEFRTGVGLGLRWRSPVGPLRVDLARGLDHPDSPFQITLNFGSDL